MKCTIKAIQEVAQGTLEVHLCPEEVYPKVIPGQYAQFTIVTPAYRDSKPTEDLCNKRIFSIIQDESNISGDSQNIIFATRISDSAFKRSLQELKVGDPMEISDPMGKFTLPQEDGRTVVFLAGGIGVTPFISMLYYLKYTKRPQPIHMIFTNNDLPSMGYKMCLEKLSEEMEHFTLHLSIHHDPNWSGESRFISPALIQELIPNWEDSTYMMVGPPPMIAIVKKALLEELHIPENRVMVEGFFGY